MAGTSLYKLHNRYLQKPYAVYLYSHSVYIYIAAEVFSQTDVSGHCKKRQCNHKIDRQKMTTYISILRGINVSGHRMIKMDALRQLFAGLGFTNIQTYIQSGNVVFQDKKTKLQDLEKKIAKRIFEQFGFEVPVLVKELEDLKQVVKNNPFLSDNSKGISHLHVTFLSAQPDKENFKKIKEGQYQADEFELFDKSVYLYCPNSYSNSKLTNSFFENKLKVVATTRNWKTTNELINIAEKISTNKL